MAERHAPSSTTREAGAIAVRFDGDEPLYLLVTAKADATQWIFPKGHVEAGESPAEAARRELLEEAGVRGHAREEVGRLRFRTAADEIEATYFLFELVAERASPEGRGKAWLPFTAAASRLSFHDARDLLTRARQQIERSP